MTTSGRFAAYAMSGLLAATLSVTVGAAPAEASITTLCTGYTGCARAGMSDGGYAASSRSMFWRMYSGHNCTNYAAYRMIRAGLANSRPWTGSGNATNWGIKMSRITNGTPAVGAIAWWRAGVRPAGSAGHVAYVERVVSANEIILSQDSWRGDFSWTRVTRTSYGWPSGFVHFKDVPLLNTKAPAITGTPKVGAALTASPGVWNPTGAALAYQWMQNGIAIAGATAASLTPKLAQQGKAITVKVTASRLGYPTTSVVSAATAAVQPGVLTSTAAPTVTGDPRVGETLSADPGTWNPVADEVRYQWRTGGDPIQGATGRTLTVDPALVGKPLSVAVTAVKAHYPAATKVSAPTTRVTPGALRLSARPTVTGTPQPGQTLVLVLPDAPPQSAVAVQWLRAGVAVSGATGRSYRLTAADVGSRLLAQITLSRPGYTTVSTRTTSSPAIRATPLIRVTAAPSKGRLAVYAAVTAIGVRPVTGAIQVRSRGKLLSQVWLQNGVARATVTGLPPGVKTYRFRYLSTSRVAGDVVVRRIKIS
ncbi:MAG: domain containing protein [Marmoricola sp.]|nr:domain containing protein [Marmoricola sp.]